MYKDDDGSIWGDYEQLILNKHQTLVYNLINFNRKDLESLDTPFIELVIFNAKLGIEIKQEHIVASLKNKVSFDSKRFFFTCEDIKSFPIEK